MDTKEFEAEFLRRINALRLSFSITDDGIKIRGKSDKWTVTVLESVEGDPRKCVCRVYHTNLRRRNGTYPLCKLMFEKPCTSYYLLQYITGYNCKTNAV